MLRVRIIRTLRTRVLVRTWYEVSYQTQGYHTQEARVTKQGNGFLQITATAAILCCAVCGAPMLQQQYTTEISEHQDNDSTPPPPSANPNHSRLIYCCTYVWRMGYDTYKSEHSRYADTLRSTYDMYDSRIITKWQPQQNQELSFDATLIRTPAISDLTHNNPAFQEGGIIDHHYRRLAFLRKNLGRQSACTFDEVAILFAVGIVSR